MFKKVSGTFFISILITVLGVCVALVDINVSQQAIRTGHDMYEVRENQVAIIHFVEDHGPDNLHRFCHLCGKIQEKMLKQQESTK